MTKTLLVCLAVTALTISDPKVALAREADNETAVCGAIREPFVFWLWRNMSGSPDPERVSHIKDLEQGGVSWLTMNSRTLIKICPTQFIGAGKTR